jgi:PAS domain S-box-containing protein
MSDASFANQVSEALQRVMAVRERTQRATGEDAAGVLSEALEELAVAFEELHVAQEELRTQNEALAATEAAAAAERNRFRDLFEFAPNGYVVTDGEGVVQQANRAACTLLGLTLRNLISKPLTVFVVPKDRPEFLAQLSGLHCGEPVWEQTVRIQPRPEGSDPRVVNLTVVPFRDPDSGEPMLRWQLRDVTEQWAATEAVRRWNDELEQRVKARTTELQKALAEKEEAERQLRLADSRKDEFLATLAREFRNPLTPLRYAPTSSRRSAAPSLDWPTRSASSPGRPSSSPGWSKTCPTCPGWSRGRSGSTPSRSTWPPRPGRRSTGCGNGPPPGGSRWTSPRPTTRSR